MPRTRLSRTASVHRFEKRERSRSQARFYELSTIAALYANEHCNGNRDEAYRELVKALDNNGFLGARVLYLHEDVWPPYFRKGPDLNSNSKVPPPPYLPHKTNPIITRKFIEGREKEMGWAATRDAYLARCWIPAKQAAQWSRSKGIALPTSAATEHDRSNDEKSAVSRPLLKKLKKPILKTGARKAARLALDALYPQGIPIDKTGQELTDAVNRYIEKQPSDLIEGRVKQEVSLDTVLRAAERK